MSSSLQSSPASSAQTRSSVEVASAEMQPTKVQSAWFAFRTGCFKIRRSLRNWYRGDAKPLTTSSLEETWPVLAVHGSTLFTSSEPSEFSLQAGKVHNMRLAAKTMDGVCVKAGQTWSFWAQVGKPVKRRGFVYGREVREGCVIPAVGGGLCQLSGAIYQAALEAGFEIVERHAHTRRVARSGMVPGRDATVFWNYVDLRVRAPFDWQMEVRLEHGQLKVELRGQRGARTQAKALPLLSVEEALVVHHAESCESCGVASCFRHAEMAGLKTQARTAYLVDEWWPEFDRHIQSQRSERDWLMLPMKSKSRYPWTVEGWDRVKGFPLFVLKRSWKSRKLAKQGAQRQQLLLRTSKELAELYVKALPFDAMHVVVAQSLLPYVWMSGALGGRTFEVLMQRPPLQILQRQLDDATKFHPQSRTLEDFRLADVTLAQAEAEALAAAERWITPHRQLAEMGGSRSVLLDWAMPTATLSAVTDTEDSKQLVFPASTLGRKGAYEVRAAARALGFRVVLGGPVLEQADFWTGVEVVEAGVNWRDHEGPVVLPVWAESQPRRLLQALSEGRRVITTKASGLAGVAGVTMVEPGDVQGLIAALEGPTRWLRCDGRIAA